MESIYKKTKIIGSEKSISKLYSTRQCCCVLSEWVESVVDKLKLESDQN